MAERGGVGRPTLERRAERWTLGIRTTTPFRGMFAVRDALLRERTGWCRYEAYLTDPRVEPRRSVWRVELAIKVADAA